MLFIPYFTKILTILGLLPLSPQIEVSIPYRLQVLITISIDRKTDGWNSEDNCANLSLFLSMPKISWAKSLVPKLTKDIPSLQRSSIIITDAGVSTIIPIFALSRGKLTCFAISFAFLTSSTEITKGSITCKLVNPSSCNLFIAWNSDFSNSCSSKLLRIPCQPNIGLASSGSSSPPSKFLNSSVLASNVLTQTGFGLNASAIGLIPSIRILIYCSCFPCFTNLAGWIPDNVIKCSIRSKPTPSALDAICLAPFPNAKFTFTFILVIGINGIFASICSSNSSCSLINFNLPS